MRTELSIGKKIGDGRGWLKLSQSKKVKYITRIARRAFPEYGDEGFLIYYANFIAGRINDFYVDSETGKVRDTINVLFIKALEVVISKTGEEMASKKEGLAGRVI